MRDMEYAAIIETTRTGFSAYVPDLPGVAATGRTRETTVRRLRTAIRWQLDALRSAGEPLPKPTTRAVRLRVA